ncbi:MAG TPA: hypothetical protein VMN38_07185 [Sphingomicrobium sp.]|nr:hypothetical protein [Sphingomicrobium sp.]
MGSLFAISAGWFALLYFRGVEKDSLDMEFAKALLQVGVVSVAATLLSVLVFDHQRRSALRKEAAAATDKQLQFRDDVLKGTLARITVTYNGTKKARRTMRALGLQRTVEKSLIRLARYDECMAEVNDAQLELEAIKSDVKTSRSAYPSADKLASSLKSMEQYLGALIEEYETVRARLGDTTAEIPMRKVPRFADFVGPSSGSEFSTKFADAHDGARAAIRVDLLHLNIPATK